MKYWIKQDEAKKNQKDESMRQRERKMMKEEVDGKRKNTERKRLLATVIFKGVVNVREITDM